jgi:hypothetical protein
MRMRTFYLVIALLLFAALGLLEVAAARGVPETVFAP